MRRKQLRWIGVTLAIALGWMSLIYAPFSNVALAQGGRNADGNQNDFHLCM